MGRHTAADSSPRISAACAFRWPHSSALGGAGGGEEGGEGITGPRFTVTVRLREARTERIQKSRQQGMQSQNPAPCARARSLAWAMQCVPCTNTRLRVAAIPTVRPSLLSEFLRCKGARTPRARARARAHAQVFTSVLAEILSKHGKHDVGAILAEQVRRKLTQPDSRHVFAVHPEQHVACTESSSSPDTTTDMHGAHSDKSSTHAPSLWPAHAPVSRWRGQSCAYRRHGHEIMRVQKTQTCCSCVRVFTRICCACVRVLQKPLCTESHGRHGHSETASPHLDLLLRQKRPTKRPTFIAKEA